MTPISLMDRGERIAARHPGPVQAGFRGDLGVEVLIFIEAQGVQLADIALDRKLLPQDPGDVFRGGHVVFEIRHVEIQVLVIELLQDMQEDLLEVEQQSLDGGGVADDL